MPLVQVTFKITRKTDSTCATQIQIPAKKSKKELSFTKTVSVDLRKLDKGEIRFACGMDMGHGVDCCEIKDASFKNVRI